MAWPVARSNSHWCQGQTILPCSTGAFGEWTAAMRADIVERQGNSLQRGHAECVTLNGEFFGLGFRWKLLPTAQPDPLTHPGTLSLHWFDAIRRRCGFDSSIFPVAVESRSGNICAACRGEKLRFAGLRECTVREKSPYPWIAAMMVPPRMMSTHQPIITMAALLRLTLATMEQPRINSRTTQKVKMSAEENSVRSHSGVSEVRYQPTLVPTGLLISNCSALTPAKMAIAASKNLMRKGRLARTRPPGIAYSWPWRRARN